MLRLNSKWGETAESLLRSSIEGGHLRLRERYLALSMIASGHTGSYVAQRLGRNRNTIAKWVDDFNQRGPEGLLPNFKGNPGKALSGEELLQLKEVVRKPPRHVGFKTGRWSGKLGAAYIQRVFNKEISPRTALRYMRNLGFRKKLPRKHFKKADPEQQEHFAQELTLLEQKRSPHSQTVWIDQGQIWCAPLLRWMWCLKAEEAFVDSTSPSKSEKICFYVAVVRPMGLVITSIVEWFDKNATAVFLDKIRATLPGWRLDLVWDGASYHKAEPVRQALQRNRIHLHPLPSYSPKMNAAEYWIRWVKTDISYNYCWEGRKALVRSFNGFALSMYRRPKEVLKRCVPDLIGFSCQ